MDLAGLRAAYQRHRYEVFFWSLLATMAALALRVPDPAVHAFFVASVFAALKAGPARRTIIALFVVTWLVRTAMPGTSVAAYSPLILGSIGIAVTVLVLRYALSAPVVGRDHVFAGLSGYLLLGLICGQLFWGMECHLPHSLVLPPDDPFTIGDGVYFSFATLTTVGYGDIFPRTDLARGLATLEAVAGQMYLAVLVARLISLYVSRKSAGPS